MIRASLLPLALIAALVPTVVGSQPLSNEPITVLSALTPVTALVTPLVEGTGIEVEAITPRPTPMVTLAAMLDRPDPERAERAEAADAVLTLRSLWPADPLYPAVRATNIWIVEIDATNPLDATRPPVPRIAAPASAPTWRNEQSKAESSASLYPWLGPSAAIAMAEIVAHDLARLSPEDAQTINANLEALRAEIRRLKAEYDVRFAGLADVTVYALTDRFVHLTNEFGLFVDGYFLEQDVRWTQEDYDGLTAHLRENNITTVIHQWEPSEKVVVAVEAAGAELVVLSTGEAMEGTHSAYIEMMRSNLDALYRALSGDPQ